MSDIATNDFREILAAFTVANRKHLRIGQAVLAKRLKLSVGTIRACEAGRKVNAKSTVALLKFNRLVDV